MNNECQAGTKAATLMLHKFKRQASFFAMLLLCAVFCQAQIRQDTSRVVLLVSDTSHRYETYFRQEPCKDTANKFYICGKEVKEDKGNNGYGQSYWMYGYLIKEQNWECCDPNNTKMAAYYWKTYKSYYVDDKKQPLKSTVIIWQSVSAK